MAIIVQCPACAQRYRLRDDLAGRTAKCKCGQLIQVPASSSASLVELCEDLNESGPATPTQQSPSSAPSIGSTGFIPPGIPGLGGDAPSPAKQSGKSATKKALNLIVTCVAAVAVLAIVLLGVWYWVDMQEKAQRVAEYKEALKYKQKQGPISPFGPGIILVDPDEDEGLKPQPPKVLPGGEKLSRELIDRVEASVVLIHTSSRSGRPLGQGSGFIVNKEGWVVTNYHVVRGAAKATLTFKDGAKTDAAGMVAFDEQRDLAILKMASVPADLKPLDLAPSEPPKSGASVFAVGHPQGLKFSVSAGVVSAVRQTSELPTELAEALHLSRDMIWVQTDAVLRGGNSGGPLCDHLGRVMGVNTFIAARQAYGFAAHVSHVSALLAKPRPQLLPLPALLPLDEIENPLVRLDPSVEQMWRVLGTSLAVEAKTEEVRQRFGEQFWQLADSDRRTLVAFQSLYLMCLMYEPGGSDEHLKRALDRLLDDHLGNRSLHSAFPRIARLQHVAVEQFLERVEKGSAHRQVQGAACFYRAVHLVILERPDLRPTALALLDRCAKDYKEIELGRTKLADAASEFRSRLQHLSVGAQAQEINGKDAFDKPLKLSDFRGKVVMLSFFTNDDPYSVLMYPQQRELIQRYQDKPFALLGVSGDSVEKLRQLIRDGKIAWRCWADGRAGPIAKAWQVDGAAIFLIDARGVIRTIFHERPREQELDQTIEKLVKEATTGKAK
jgi:peroxiredoxin